jgi:WXG100 family type VII secretion target
MGQKLRFDPASLQGSAGRLAEATAGIRDELTALEAAADKLIGQWSGEAADAYRKAQSEWNAGLARMNDILAKSSSAADAAAARYAAVQTKIAERWS